MAQPSIVYTVYVDFVAYSCSLSAVQVSLYDQSGHSVASASSPFGGEVALSFRTSSPTDSLVARADGSAGYGSYYSWGVSGIGKVRVDGGGYYWMTVRMA